MEKLNENKFSIDYCGISYFFSIVSRIKTLNNDRTNKLLYKISQTNYSISTNKYY